MTVVGDLANGPAMESSGQTRELHVTWQIVDDDDDDAPWMGCMGCCSITCCHYANRQPEQEQHRGTGNIKGKGQATGRLIKMATKLCN